ncbi:hypothetical protein HY29_17445 [Hyphomonas beringensis]|uniref:Uncharacterized protein n=1 Tax=Hyphomonas beringensis TaxID=1280946 RepID=A0A062U9E4_9PROT|nr:hypothetical protein [Hyphomonas beringensis]KCZ53199.1 hypothetical protein HY29_17445 [Hyphomonas beringensis]
MIKAGFLKKQREKSRSNQSTTPFLRRLVFHTVDQVALEHYGADYAMKCAQTAGAAQRLLSLLGVQSRLTLGAACFPKIAPDGRFLGWTGFWGDDHHIWLTTEFFEVADLSIARLHDHPETRGAEMPTPAIWWGYQQGWPPIIRYLEDTFIDRIALSCALEQASFEAFLEKVEVALLSILNEQSVSDIRFDSVLMNVDQLNALTDANDRWATAAYFVPAHNITFPDWIVEREKELEYFISRNQRPPSRLSLREDLIR